MRPFPALDGPAAHPWDEPASRRDQWRAAIYLSSTALAALLVVLAVVFDQFAATGVLLVGFLSVWVAYLLGPATEWLRDVAGRSHGGRPLSRSLAALMIFGVVALACFPVWVLLGPTFNAAVGRMRTLVPAHTARFVAQLHAADGWHDAIGLPMGINRPLGGLTRAVTDGVEAEARALAAELVEIKGLVPWLSTVPVVAFLLLTRWHRFRSSTSRVLPTPHLRWRVDEFLGNLNSLLAAYTRAQTMSAVVIGVACWAGFAALRVPYPGTLGLTAGLLEMVPLAGPIIAAVVATSMAPDQALPLMGFLAVLRVVQDYAIYPRLISQAMDLHPLAVVVAIWVGAAVGGVVGVCLAVPAVGMLQVTRRHWREYRDVEARIAAAGMRAEAG